MLFTQCISINGGGCHGGYGSGRRSNRWTSEDCVRLCLSDLRRDGALQRNVMARRERRWYCDGECVADLTIVADVDCLQKEPCLRIEGRAMGQAINQHLLLDNQPLHLGGERWYALCPLTGKRCVTLVLPPDMTFFASMSGWRIPYSCQREDRTARSHRAIGKLEGRLRGLSKYARKSTIKRLRNRIAHHQDMIEEDICQLRQRIFDLDGAGVG